MYGKILIYRIVNRLSMFMVISNIDFSYLICSYIYIYIYIYIYFFFFFFGSYVCNTVAFKCRAFNKKKI